ncbi:phage protein Gp36 family protein [Pseudoalteromonas rubra]|uniref:phage protein Gp36 family protein n=1 Tax=Pseudoalteromonas rubra TaxID=43658 RepID=UPI002DB76037|nr:phage protein Gp36 family protein [Pseudoalteromonas rubra]MEC4091831.1 phage protein Gp36 family protein [Pseudoalteromonas rubra]
MFVDPSHVLNSIGLNGLLAFANGRFALGFDAQQITEDDLNQALTGTPETDLQTTVANWFKDAASNVNNTIFGYVARFNLNPEEIDSSPLRGIAADLMRYELCNNDIDESILTRRKHAMQELDKIAKGVIQVKASTPASHGPVRTAAPGSQFNWQAY